MKPSSRIAWLIVAAVAASALAGAKTNASSGDPVADFYRGKTIDLNIGFSAGGGFDLYARTVAQFLGRHIPGDPKILPVQMPGAGSVRAAQFMAFAAPQDGTQLATIAQSVPLEQALGQPGISFDARTFGWIGNPVSGGSALIVWAATGVRTLADAKKRVVTIGSDGDNVTSQYPLALNAVVGARFKIVLGYPGGRDINLAMEQGEVDGEGQSEWSTLLATEPSWLREKKINLLVQIGLKKNPQMEAYMGRDVPLLADLAANQRDRRALQLLSSGEGYGRSLLTTPHVPRDRLAALRAAFDATMTDPDFLATAKRLKMQVSPVSGEDLQRLTDFVESAPPAAVSRLKAILGK